MMRRSRCDFGRPWGSGWWDDGEECVQYGWKLRNSRYLSPQMDRIRDWTRVFDTFPIDLSIQIRLEMPMEVVFFDLGGRWFDFTCIPAR